MATSGLVRVATAYLAAHPSGLRVLPTAVSSSEAAALVDEVATLLRRMRYAPAHFDNAIEGYRELRRREWRAHNREVLDRLGGMANAARSWQAAPVEFSSEVHVLDLAPEGAILPHVDSERFVGPVIAGLSLLSPALMRFEHKDDP
jgi:alkylated DNA repair protein alkB family protein 7